MLQPPNNKQHLDLKSPPELKKTHPPTAPAVNIILGHYNGEKFIREQLASIYAQTHQNFKIEIFDDQSTSSALKLLHSLQKENPNQLTVTINETNKGFSRNFLEGLSACAENFEFFAFSDQDDIWYPDKLERAIAQLQKLPPTKPALYCARTTTVDQDGQIVLGYSPLFKRPPTFKNALVQSIAGGNTMVFNRAARNLIVAGSQGVRLFAHDWWAYMLVSGAGGVVYYDPTPALKYRQHAQNLIGSNNSLRAKLKRVGLMLKGYFKEKNDINFEALLKYQNLLNAQNQKTLQILTSSRKASLLKRIIGFYRSGVYRQTFSGNIALVLAAILKRI